MIKVGLVGEDPNDTLSIKSLLEKKYKGKVQFYQLVKGIKGFHLDNLKIRKSLPIEFADKKCKFVVFIRDLDGFQSEEEKLKAKRDWFKKLDAVVNNKGILLLNIWELEALILCDIETFNRQYKTRLKFKNDPMRQKEPKEWLKQKTFQANRQFSESHCPEIFKALNIELLEERCNYFKDFISEFEKKIA